MSGSDSQRVLKLYGARFAERLMAQADSLSDEVIQGLARDLPELVGPDPRLLPLALEVFSVDLRDLTTALVGQTPFEWPSVPLVAAELGRLAAQLGIPSNHLLWAHQFQKRVATHRLIECGAAIVADHDDLALLVDTALAYEFAHGDTVLQATLAAYASVPGTSATNSALGLSGRVDAVLDGRVTDLAVAERMLGYRLAGHHVAVIVWFDDPVGRPPDMLAADRGIRALPGVRDALVAPKDERTLRCWLSVGDEAAVDEWIDIGRERGRGQGWRVALGEPEVGIEGFRLSHLQALAAGTVLAAARPEAGPVARYRDVSTISFMVDQPAEARVWVREILGDLAEPGAEQERLRHTLHVFFEEGEDAVATSHRLFVHRNTVKYRLDQAKRRLPRGFTDRRLEIALALKYCEWIPLREVSTTQ